MNKYSIHSDFGDDFDPGYSLNKDCDYSRNKEESGDRLDDSWVNQIIANGDELDLITSVLETLPDKYQERLYELSSRYEEFLDSGYGQASQERADFIFSEIFEYLNEIAPLGTYFGQSPDNKEIFGFWEKNSGDDTPEKFQVEEEEFSRDTEARQFVPASDIYHNIVTSEKEEKKAKLIYPGDNRRVDEPKPTDPQEIIVEEVRCPECGGEGNPMGVMDNKTWCCCQGCGHEFYTMRLDNSTPEIITEEDGGKYVSHSPEGIEEQFKSDPIVHTNIM